MRPCRALAAGAGHTPYTNRLLRDTGGIALIWAALAACSFGPRVELAVYGATVVLAIGLHAQLIRRAGGALSQESAGHLLTGFALLMGVYALLASPTHLDAARLRLAVGWVDRWHNASFVTTHWWDYAPTLMVRLNFPFQALWLASVVLALRRRRDAPYAFLLLAFAVPFAILTLSRWKANYYLLTVLPICYLMIAGFLTEAWRRASPTGRRAWLAFWAVSALWYGQQMASLSPWYELDGYRLGPAFQGQSRAAFVTTEGMSDIIGWTEAMLPAGTDVAVYLTDHVKYSGYAYNFVQRAMRRGTLRFRNAKTPAELSGAQAVLLSTYTAAVGPALVAAGYARVHTVSVLTIPHYTVYAMPEIAARMARRDAGGLDAR